MRIYLNHSLNKHYTGGTRVTIRRQFPRSSPAGLLAAAQTVVGGPARRGCPVRGGLVPGVPSSGLVPYGNQTATGGARRREGDARFDVVFLSGVI